MFLNYSRFHAQHLKLKTFSLSHTGHHQEHRRAPRRRQVAGDDTRHLNRANCNLRVGERTGTSRLRRHSIQVPDACDRDYDEQVESDPSLYPLQRRGGGEDDVVDGGSVGRPTGQSGHGQDASTTAGGQFNCYLLYCTLL